MSSIDIPLQMDKLASSVDAPMERDVGNALGTTKPLAQQRRELLVDEMVVDMT